ncbi:MAG TPA: 6-carboxytetrahydropterin synthase QueD [Bryobacteraceae bacterium]|nr:6-carboxytetrahydropterin synthase QueD [Bryobacteraceae bacterium]
MFEISVEEAFAAGHSLRNYHGKCEKVHGHNYKVQVTLEGGTLNEAGLLMDFVELKRVLHSAVERLDHEFLNDIPPFDVLNPSAENMAKYFHDEVSKGLTAAGIRVSAVKLWETDTSTATYRP